MGKQCVCFFGALLLLAVSTSVDSAQEAPPSILSPTPAPAPAPAQELVNLTHLLSVTGPYDKFLSYLLQTKVMDTFQNQANNTDGHGITIFAPTNSAFSSLKKPSLSNLTKDQFKSLLLFHALPRYYSLAEFKDLSKSNPVSTFAGGKYNLNVSYASGVIHVDSGWSNPKLSSSIISTSPVAVYEIQHVLLPVAIFGEAPPPAPSPAPSPETAKPSDASPNGTPEAAAADSPRSDSTKPTGFAPADTGFHVLGRAVTAISGGLMLLL